MDEQLKRTWHKLCGKEKNKNVIDLFTRYACILCHSCSLRGKIGIVVILLPRLLRHWGRLQLRRPRNGL